jgi:uncharacterized protein
MRRKFITLLAALPLALGTGAAFAQSTGKQGVAIQVSDGDVKTWNQALNVVRNIQAEYGKDNVDVELVVFGYASGLLKFDSTLANRVDDALANGTKVLMCENTMQGQKLTKADMHPKIGYVKAGVVEIIEKQKQGWAVVRP